MLYVHLVSFALRDGVEAKTFFAKLNDLYVSLEKQEIAFYALETGSHDGSEMPNNNLHYFRVVFASEADFKKYLEHPEHAAFAEKAVTEWINPASLTITNTPAAFKQEANKLGKPESRPRSYSSPT